MTTNVAWYFYVIKKRWSPEVWLQQYDALHLLIGHRHDIDPRLVHIYISKVDIPDLDIRYEEAHEFNENNIKWLDMNVPMMFRYYWYGSLDIISNQSTIDMDKVNEHWLKCDGDPSKFDLIKY